MSIQLNRLNWRDFLQRENPLASALMAKMRIAPGDRPRVKAECLRLLATLELNPEKMELISGFIGTYLRLNEQEEEQFQQEIEEMGLTTKDNVMLFATDWQEKGRELGRQEGLQEGRVIKGQEDVIRILEVRFEEIPVELREQIDRINDLEVLGTLLVQAVTAQTLEAFEAIPQGSAERRANQSEAEENGEA